MRKYICIIPVLVTSDAIAHKGDIVELDENSAEIKALELMKLITPLETEEPTKTKIKK